MSTALRSIWTWFAITVLIVVWLPLVAVIRLFDRDPARYVTGRWFRRLGVLMTRVNPFWTIEVSGVKVENPRRPYVVVSNHQSFADIPIISLLPWEMKWVAKIELLKIPFVGWMMQLAGDIPVNRQDRISRAKVLVHAKDYLRKKCSVMFFPEGTRSKDGRVLPFTDGAFRLAISAGVPVLPLVLDGTSNALPKNSWKFGKTDVFRLKVLPPIETEGMKTDDVPALRDRVRNMILGELAAWRGVTPDLVDSTRTGTIASPAGTPVPAAQKQTGI